MGMFDTFIPDPHISCPVCGALLSDWQGKDADCALFVWRQGLAAPIDQTVPEEARLTDAQRSTLRLPQAFEIYSYDCDCPFPVEAICTCTDGVWDRTDVVTAATAWRKPGERRGTFKARMKWLSGERN